MTECELDGMRAAGRLAADALEYVGGKIRVGMKTEEINTLAHRYILAHDAYPATLNYKGFPKSLCTSVNNVVCHGIPGPLVLKDGDIINVDITVILKGFFGDNSKTFYVGTPGDEARRVTEVCRTAFELGIAAVRPGGHLGDIGEAIQSYVEGHGCSVVTAFVGHGIGKRFHLPPQVQHVGRKGTGEVLRPGVIFTVEPMINGGASEVYVDEKDRWTVFTEDGSLSAQFEHTVLVTETGVEILTLPTPTEVCDV
jgi:methionyl aminopeptidase